MAHSAGNYKFKDFVKIGAPVGIIFWIIAALLIPVFYSF
jgi:di/tricarboxylate transporter